MKFYLIVFNIILVLSMKEMKDMVMKMMKMDRKTINKNKKIKRKKNLQKKKKNLNLKERVIKGLQLKSLSVKINDLCYLRC